MDRRDLKEVMRLSEKSIKHYKSTQDFRSLSTEFSNLSRFVLEISDDYELAHTLAISALNYAEGVGEIDRIITCKMTLCTVYFAKGQINDFKNLFSQINYELQGLGINPKLRWESQQFPFEILNSI